MIDPELAAMAALIALIPVVGAVRVRRDRRALAGARRRDMLLVTNDLMIGRPIGVVYVERVVALDVARHALMLLSLSFRREWPVLTRWFDHQRQVTLAHLVEKATVLGADCLVGLRWTECRLGRLRPRLVTIVYATGVKSS